MYIFDDKMIHDHDAMWDLALNFYIKYRIWSEEIEKLKTDDFSMKYDGELIFKHNDEKRFKSAIADYKQRVKVLETMLEFDLERGNCNYDKYISKS